MGSSAYPGNVNKGEKGDPGDSGSSGVMVLVADTLLGSPAVSFDFTAISDTGKHLRLILQVRSTAATTVEAMALKFNNDAGSSYVWVRHAVYDATGHGVYASDAGSPPASGTEGRVSFVCGANAEAGGASCVVIDIPNYAGTAFFKNYLSETVGVDADIRRDQFGGVWRNPAAINRITLTLAAGNFDTGSRASLYLVN